MISDIGVIIYQSRSYGPNGQFRNTQTRHLAWKSEMDLPTEIGGDGRTFCRKQITRGTTKSRWMPENPEFHWDTEESRRTICAQCLARLAIVKDREYLQRARERQNAPSATEEAEVPLDTPKPVDTPLEANSAPQTTAGEGVPLDLDAIERRARIIREALPTAPGKPNMADDLDILIATVRALTAERDELREIVARYAALAVRSGNLHGALIERRDVWRNLAKEWEAACTRAMADVARLTEERNELRETLARIRENNENRYIGRNSRYVR